MVDLNNCKYVVWGFTIPNRYHTHSHIHAAFYRTLQLTGKEVLWLDSTSNLDSIDFQNTFFITEHGEAKQGIPLNSTSFYLVHGLNDDPVCKMMFAGIKNRLSWNVYHSYSHGNPERWDGTPIESVESYREFMKNATPDEYIKLERIFLDEDAPYYPAENRIDFRWATDLVPSEIEANKPGIVLQDNKVIYYIGSDWFVNKWELSEFRMACIKNDIDFRVVGAGQNGIISIEENQRLVRESYFAPTILGSHHLTENYVSCRAFKNTSYGRMCVTNSEAVNKIFGNKAIFNRDPHELFYTAVEELKHLKVERIHELMDLVARKHTYLNRLNVIMKAAKLVMEN